MMRAKGGAWPGLALPRSITEGGTMKGDGADGCGFVNWYRYLAVPPLKTPCRER